MATHVFRAVCLLSLILGLACASVQEPRTGQRKTLSLTIYEASLGTTDTGTLDPLRTYQMPYFNLQHQIFETLVTLDLNTQTVKPLLARSWEKTSDRTMRFHLRRGVRFHNGEPLTAEAVKFSLDLMLDPRQRFGGRFLLNSIAEVRIVDEFTVEIDLHYHDARLLRRLAIIGFILPPQYFKSAGETYFSRNPMGTGPYRFFYNRRSDKGIREVHLVANEDYWGAARPAIHEIAYKFIPREQQWQALVDGEVDLLITQAPEPEATSENNPSLVLKKKPSLRTAFCLLNIDKAGPLQDVRVRRAVEHAVNRKQLIARALLGYGKPLYASTAAEGSLSYHGAAPRYSESAAKAAGLLAQAGYPDGITLRLMASANQPTTAVAEMLKQQLAAAGITLEVHLLSRDETIQEIIVPKLQGRPRPSTYDIWPVSGWPDLFGANGHFYFLFLNSQGIFNFGISQNKKSRFDELYNKARLSPNRPALARNVQHLDSYLLDQALVVPLYQVELLYAMRKGVSCAPGLNDMPLRFTGCSVD